MIQDSQYQISQSGINNTLSFVSNTSPQRGGSVEVENTKLKDKFQQ